MIIKFKKEPNDYDTREVELSIESESLETILDSFGDFLRACGFVFKGHVDIWTDVEFTPEEEYEKEQ